MSARAAWRLESLGFTQVFRYTAGKKDWSASGLPVEGKGVGIGPIDIARRDIPTCRLTETLGTVQKRVAVVSQNLCVVVNDQGVVLGRLREQALQADPETLVEEVMESGPTTIRPDEPLEGITGRMREHRVENILVTNGDGQLIGVMHRSDAEQALHELHQRPEAADYSRRV